MTQLIRAEAVKLGSTRTYRMLALGADQTGHDGSPFGLPVSSR